MLWGLGGDCKVGVGGLIFCLISLDFFVKIQFMDSKFFFSLPTVLISFHSKTVLGENRPWLPGLLESQSSALCSRKDCCELQGLEPENCSYSLTEPSLPIIRGAAETCRAVSAAQFPSPIGLSALVSPWSNTCLSIAHLWQPRAVQTCTHTMEHLPGWHWALLLLPKAVCPTDDKPFWVPAPYLLYLHLWPALDHCLCPLSLSSSWSSLLVWYPQFASDFSDLSCNTVLF